VFWTVAGTTLQFRQLMVCAICIMTAPRSLYTGMSNPIIFSSIPRSRRMWLTLGWPNCFRTLGNRSQCHQLLALMVTLLLVIEMPILCQPIIVQFNLKTVTLNLCAYWKLEQAGWGFEVGFLVFIEINRV